MNQNFKIMHQGLIQGGTASYLANTDTGVVSYSAQVLVGLFFTKTYSESGTYPAVSADLLSSAVVPGAVIVIGDVTFTVLNVAADTAHVTFTVAGQNITGAATLDLTKPYWAIEDLTAVAVVDGFTLNLHLVPT